MACTGCSVADIATSIGILFTGGSAFFAYLTYSRSARTQRASFSLTIWEAFADIQIRSMYNKIEWGDFQLSSSNGELSEEQKVEEVHLQRLLSLFDEIALLIEAGVFSNADKQKWMKHGIFIFRNSSVLEYIIRLDSTYTKISDNLLTKRKYAYEDARRVFNKESMETAYSIASKVALKS